MAIYCKTMDSELARKVIDALAHAKIPFSAVRDHRIGQYRITVPDQYKHWLA